jgi:hypothetical protein
MRNKRQSLEKIIEAVKFCSKLRLCELHATRVIEVFAMIILNTYELCINYQEKGVGRANIKERPYC